MEWQDGTGGLMNKDVNNVDPIELLNVYRVQLEQKTYELEIKSIVLKQYQQLIDDIYKKHPDIEQEVKHGTDSKQTKS